MHLNDTVTELHISNCGFRSTAIYNLAEKLKNNFVLLKLETSYNRITNDAQDTVQAEIEANNALNLLRHNTSQFDTAKMSTKVNYIHIILLYLIVTQGYLALARKLHALPMGVLQLLHKNPSFNVVCTYSTGRLLTKIYISCSF